MAQSLYDVLQVSPEAELEVIEAAYRRLAQKYHPDHDHSPGAHQRMQRLNHAHRILRDPSQRGAYDRARRLGSAQRFESARPRASRPVEYPLPPIGPRLLLLLILQTPLALLSLATRRAWPALAVGAVAALVLTPRLGLRGLLFGLLVSAGILLAIGLAALWQVSLRSGLAAALRFALLQLWFHER